jgi:hypothetical protein
MAIDIEKVKITIKIYADEVRQVMPVVKVFYMVLMQEAIRVRVHGLS